MKLINHIRNDRGDTLQILEILEIMRAIIINNIMSENSLYTESHNAPKTKK